MLKVCQAEPRFGCPDPSMPLLPGTDDVCIIGYIESSEIPAPPPAEPCDNVGVQLAPGAFLVYPHPYMQDSVRVCATATPMMNYCPQDVGYTGQDSRFINPETGMCEVQPGQWDRRNDR